MAMPTWKNVSQIQNEGVADSLLAASKLANSGAASFKNVITEQNTARKANYDTATENLNRRLQAEVAGSDNIAGLKNTLQTLNPAELQKRFGSRVDLTALKQAGTEQEAKLTLDAVNTALPQAQAAAHEAQSNNAAYGVLSETLTKQGVPPVEINKILEGYRASHVKDETMFQENIATNTAKKLNELGILETNDAINKATQTAGLLTGKDKIDADALYRKLTAVKLGHDTDLDNNQKKIALDKAVAQRSLVQQYSAKLSQQIQNTGDTAGATRWIMSQGNLTPESKEQLHSGVVDKYVDLGKLNVVQAKQLENKMIEYTTRNDQVYKQDQAVISGLQDVLVQESGISPGSSAAVRKITETGGNVFETLGKPGQTTGVQFKGLFRNLFNIDVDIDDTMIQKMGDIYNTLRTPVYDTEKNLTKPGLSSENALTILYETMQQTYPANLINGKGSGIDPIVANKRAVEISNQFLKSRKLATRIRELQDEAEYRKANQSIANNNAIVSAYDSFSKANIMGNGKTATPVKESNTPPAQKYVSPGQDLLNEYITKNTVKKITDAGDNKEDTSDDSIIDTPSENPDNKEWINNKLQQEAAKTEALNTPAQALDHANSPRTIQITIAKEALKLPYDKVKRGFILPGYSTKSTAKQGETWLAAQLGIKQLDERGIKYTKKQLPDGRYILKITKRSNKK